MGGDPPVLNVSRHTWRGMGHLSGFKSFAEEMENAGAAIEHDREDLNNPLNWIVSVTRESYEKAKVGDWDSYDEFVRKYEKCMTFPGSNVRRLKY